MRKIWYWALAVAGAVAIMVGFVLTVTLRADATAAVWAFVGPLPLLGAGAYLYWRRPEHRIAELLLVFATASFAFPYPVEAITAGAASDGIPDWAWASAWVTTTLEAIGLVALVRLVSLLPDGMIETRWEQRLLMPLWVVVLVPTLAFVTNPLVPLPEYTYPGFGEVTSGIHIEAFTSLGSLFLGLNQATWTAFLVGIGLLALRYRRGDTRRRRRLRWVLLAAAIAVAVWSAQYLLVAVGVLPPLGHSLVLTLFWLPVLLIPASIVVAVLEPPWLDVDVVIRRSFVYGILSFVILFLYVSLASALGMASASRLPLELAIVVTVVVAAAFQPLRRRLQHLADRWVFGKRASDYEVVTGFTDALQEAMDPTELIPQLASAVQQALDLRWVRVDIVGEAATTVGEPDDTVSLEVPVEHQQERLGVIFCGKPKEGRLRESQVQLVKTLAAQAAMALYNARLAGRVVQAQEAERRRIERNIHDGAQQELVALVAKLGMARASLRNQQLDEESLAELQTEARRILSDLRELAQGIHPSVLTDAGLLEAIEDRCSRLPIDVSLDAKPSLRSSRYPDEIEGAAYFFVTEALANVLKHSRAAHTRISVTEEPGRLVIEIEDDGVGFDPGSIRANGLAGLTDRISALGGTLRVSSQPERGTALAAVLPVDARSAR